MQHRRLNNDVFERECFQGGEEKNNSGSLSNSVPGSSNSRPQHHEDEGIFDGTGGSSYRREANDEHSYRSVSSAMNPSSFSSEIPGLAFELLQGNFSKRESEVTTGAPSTVRLPGSEYSVTNAALQAVASRSAPCSYHPHFLQQPQSSVSMPPIALKDSSSSRSPPNGSISTALNEVKESQARLMMHISRATELVQKSPPTSRLSTGDDQHRKLPVAEKKIVIPCRARGMPADHSTKTAYLVIKEGMQHGDPLLCTHDVCRKRGVRFMYCAYCDEPVAKGNFSTRHSHPGESRKNLRANNNDDSSAGAGMNILLEQQEGEARSTSYSSENSGSRRSESGQNNEKKTLLSTLATAAAAFPVKNMMTAAVGAGGHHRIGGEQTRHEEITTRAPSSLSSVQDEQIVARLQQQVACDDEDNYDDDEETHSTRTSSQNIDDEQDSEEEYYDDSSTSSLFQQGPKRKASRSTTTTTEEAERKVEQGGDNSSSSNKWASLLEERPTTKDGNELQSWLARVIAYSEPLATDGGGKSDTTPGIDRNPPKRPRTTDAAADESTRTREGQSQT